MKKIKIEEKIDLEKYESFKEACFISSLSIEQYKIAVDSNISPEELIVQYSFGLSTEKFLKYRESGITIDDLYKIGELGIGREEYYKYVIDQKSNDQDKEKDIPTPEKHFTQNHIHSVMPKKWKTVVAASLTVVGGVVAAITVGENQSIEREAIHLAAVTVAGVGLAATIRTLSQRISLSRYYKNFTGENYKVPENPVKVKSLK